MFEVLGAILLMSLMGTRSTEAAEEAMGEALRLSQYRQGKLYTFTVLFRIEEGFAVSMHPDPHRTAHETTEQLLNRIVPQVVVETYLSPMIPRGEAYDLDVDPRIFLEFDEDWDQHVAWLLVKITLEGEFRQGRPTEDLSREVFLRSRMWKRIAQWWRKTVIGADFRVMGVVGPDVSDIPSLSPEERNEVESRTLLGVRLDRSKDSYWKLYWERIQAMPRSAS